MRCYKQREQAADRRHGDVRENQGGPLCSVEHGVENDEDDQNGDGQNDQKAPTGPLLARVLSSPIDAVARRQLYLMPDLVDCFAHGRTKVAVTDRVFDGHIALAAFAVDFFRAICRIHLRHLSQRDAFAGRRDNTNVLDGFAVWSGRDRRSE